MENKTMIKNVEFKKDDLVVFTDAIGHIAVATYIDGDDNTVVVKNPMWIGLVPIPNEQRFRIETPQWFFRDFLADHNEDTVWHLSRQSYSFMESRALSIDIVSHYSRSFAAMVGEPVSKNGIIENNKSSMPGKAG